MKWTRMVATVTLALAAVATSGGRSDAGELFDRLFRRRPKEPASRTDRSLELVRTAYEGGEVSILELLDAQRQSNASHAAYLEVLSKLVQRWAEVEYLVQ